MGRLERRFRRARERLPECVIEVTPIRQRVHLGRRTDGRPFGLDDVAAELGITMEPLTHDLAERLKAEGRFPAKDLDRALKHGGAFSADRHSVFFRVD